MEKITKDVWVAVDGTEFESEEECSLYDDRVKEKVIYENFNKVALDNMSSYPADSLIIHDSLGCREEVSSIYFLYLKNESDFGYVVDYLNYHNVNECGIGSVGDCPESYPYYGILTIEDCGWSCLTSVDDTIQLYARNINTMMAVKAEMKKKRENDE